MPMVTKVSKAHLLAQEATFGDIFPLTAPPTPHPQYPQSALEGSPG